MEKDDVAKTVSIVAGDPAASSLRRKRRERMPNEQGEILSYKSLSTDLKIALLYTCFQQ